ncbi:amidohydrolase family protein [Streptosporangium sp. NPDC006007]|uniref:metal-dependent hydrolase family protein n=1 Tax=Streptosporangium sp. NPDC006007 TaxID=3154575 RepID=UPI00339E5031
MTRVIRCGQLIDGTGADPVDDMTIVVDDDGIIVEVGRNVSPPAGATVTDASGYTVLPGLIDCHVHLVTLAGRTLAERLATPYSLGVAEGYLNAGKMLRAGFTTVRDLSGMPLGGKMALDRGLFPGPHLKIAVAALSQTAGHGDQTTLSGVCTQVPDPEHPLTVVDGADQVRRAARELLRAGADQIKIYTSGGVMSDHGGPGTVGFSPEEVAAAVQVAHTAGKPVAAHAISAGGIRLAVEAGVDSIEHGMFLDDDTIAEMVRRGTYLVPTLLAPVWIRRRAERQPGSVPSHMLAKVETVVEAHTDSFRRAVQAGVRIAFGTDTGVVPHGFGAEELELMVRYGMTPMAALVSATKTAAELTGVAGQTGTLTVGKRADLLIVAGDPLADITLPARPDAIRGVAKSGVFHVEEM